MTQKVTAAGVQVEQRPDTSTAEVMAAGVQVEQRVSTPNAQVMAIGVMVELQVRMQVMAAGVMVEQQATGERQVMALGVMVEIQYPYVRPEIVTECAPEVDSAHQPAARYALGGPMFSGEVDTALKVAGIDNAGPTVSGEPPESKANALPLGGPTVSGEVDLSPKIASLPGGGSAPVTGVPDTAHQKITPIVQSVTTVTIYRPTRSQRSNIAIAVYQPVIWNTDYYAQGHFIRSMEDMAGGWTHTTSVDGGYISASLNMADTRPNLADWIEYGLGRHVEVFNESAQIVWEGFVNSMSVRYGPLTFQRGPLMGVANRVWATYSPVDYSTEPPTKGSTQPTIIVDSTASKLKWGIFEEVINAGECTDAEAEYYRDSFIYENSNPKQSKDIAYGDSAEYSVSLELMGYKEFLNRYYYTSSSFALTTASAKILQVIQASPNTKLFDGSGAGIETNALLVPEGTADENNTALNVIQGIRALGDVNDQRWLFGIYAGRRPHYTPKETTVSYLQRLADPNQQVRDLSGRKLAPWNVMPGKWLMLEDFLPGKPVNSADLRNDPRALYIEEVTFTHPWGLQIRGGGGDGKLAQFVAKLGLRGI